MSETLELLCDSAALRRLTPFVAAFAQAQALSAELLYALTLCVEEAASNAVRHGTPNAPVQLSLHAAADTVVAELVDHGIPFDPLQAPPPVQPATLAEARPGGLGIHLMREFCPDIRYARQDGANRLTLTFPRAP
jgi:anti-sigma regulatory factor (Ser/Thr protein kinase)